MNNDKLFLVVEDKFEDFEIIRESVPGAGKDAVRFKVKGPYFLMEEMNINKRRYPKEISMPVFESYINEKVKKDCAYGELEHSDVFDINLKNVCHRVTDMKVDGNHWIGESVILSGHPCGDMLAALINSGSRFGMSSRSAGSFNGDKTIIEKFYLSGFDAVANPSIAKFVDGILQEKAFMVDNHGMIVEAAFNTLEKKLEKMPNTTSEKQQHIIDAIQTFLRAL